MMRKNLRRGVMVVLLPGLSLQVYSAQGARHARSVAPRVPEGYLAPTSVRGQAVPIEDKTPPQRLYDNAVDQVREGLSSAAAILSNVLPLAPLGDTTQGWGVGHVRAAFGATIIAPMVQAFKGIGTEYVTAANAYFSAMSDLSTGGASAGTEVMSAGQLTSATRGTLHDDAIRAIIAAGALDSVNLEGSHMGDADALNNWDAYAGTLDAVLVAGGNWTANFTALTTDINATNDLSKFFGVAHATITSAQFKSHSNIVTAQTERNNAIALFTYLYARHLNGTAGQAITTAGMGVRAGAGAANGVAIRGSSYHAMWRLLVYALYGYVDPK